MGLGYDSGHDWNGSTGCSERKEESLLESNEAPHKYG